MRDYQVEAVEAIIAAFEMFTKVLVVMATGLGKTVVFANFLARTTGKRVLVLAHRTTLVDQAISKFEKWWPAYENYAELHTIQWMGRDANLQKFERDAFDIIVIDEAHHVFGDGYQKVLGYFDTAKVLGVTATPERADKKDIMSFFENKCFERDITWGITNGWLTKISVLKLPIEIDLSAVKKIAGDLDAHGVTEQVTIALQSIIAKAAGYIKDRKSVFFLPSVRSAKLTADLLTATGISAKAIYSGLSEKEKKEILDGFENNEFSVLCNAMLLTEGWDCPDVNCICNLRATTHIGLYKQILGRGLRPADGKTDCLVLDFMWHSDKYDLAKVEDIVEKKHLNVIVDGPRFSSGASKKEAENNLLKRLLEVRDRNGRIILDGKSVELARRGQIASLCRIGVIDDENIVVSRWAANQAALMLARGESKEKVAMFLDTCYENFKKIVAGKL